MNYKIIGSDQQQYGPISQEQLLQWMTEGRVNAETLVQAEGSADWRPLGTFPELRPPPAALGAAPAPFAVGPAPVASQSAALAALQGPAIGLLVTGILGAVMGVLGIFGNLLGMSFSKFMPPQAVPGFNPAAFNALLGGTAVVSGLVHIALAGVIIYGALQMKKLVNYRMAMAASILALVPCVSPCCMLGLPIGIWALVVLVKPEVKSMFQ